MTKKYKKDRKICFTIPQHGYESSNFKKIFLNNTDKIRYLIVGYEWSKSTSYPHYQCYIQLYGNQMRRKQFQEMIGFNCHMENQRGTNQEARNYCWKGQFEDKGTEFPQPSSITEIYGKFCEGQGERTEMLDIKELLDEGWRHIDICNRQENYLYSYGRYHAFYCKYKHWADDERLCKMREPLNVFVIHGDCGTGKTQSIYNKWGVKNCYCLCDPKGDNKNWNGYENQKVLIIDDFYSWLPFNQMLRLLDNKPYRVRKLNGYRWAQWETVYITSNKSPKSWYPNMRYNDDNEEMMRAFYSRIQKCLKVTRGNTGALVVTSYDIRDSDRNKHKEYLQL